MSDQASSNGGRGRRPLTMLDWAKLFSNFGGALVVVCGVVGWAFDTLPIVKAQEFREETASTHVRLSALELGLDRIAISQKETQQLQLQDRLQRTNDRLAQLKSDNVDYQYFIQQRNETLQRLDQVTSDLERSRRADR